MTDTFTSMMEDSIKKGRNLDSLYRSASILAKDTDEPGAEGDFRRDCFNAVAIHDAFMAEINAKIANGGSFAIGQRVRMIEEQTLWGSEIKPTVGLVGVVADPNEDPYPEAPEGRVPVLFPCTDLGFAYRDDRDEIDNMICLYLHNFTLEIAEDDAVSVLPEPVTYTANPAPEGMRWGVMMDTPKGTSEEVGGTGCYCHGEMVEYVERFSEMGMRVELLSREGDPSWMRPVLF